MNTKILFKKIKNTFLTPRLYNLVIKKEHYNNVVSGIYSQSLITKILFKLFYFYPQFKDEGTWAEGDKEKYRDYSSFDKIDDTHHKLTLDKIYELTPNKDLPVLDLGCNQGRHIRHLYKKGLRNLHGVDIMKSALKYFEENYEDIYKDCNLENNFFQKYLDKTNDNFFYNSYTIGATIELIHPSYNIIKELVRVTKKNIILLINEDDHWYPRFYAYEFERNNTKLIYYKKFGKKPSLLVFEKV
jgi:SAM-dependent methyltransferase